MDMQDLVQHIEIIKAYKDGHVIEVLEDDGNWVVNDGTFFPENVYRVASCSFVNALLKANNEHVTMYSPSAKLYIRPQQFSKYFVNDWTVDDTPF